MLDERRSKLSSAGILLMTWSRSSASSWLGSRSAALLYRGQAFPQQTGFGTALVQQGSDDEDRQRDHHEDRDCNQDEHAISRTAFQHSGYQPLRPVWLR